MVTSTLAAGDSAGGGLSVTSLLPARDEGLPAAIIAFSAGLDATCSGESMDSEAGIDPVFTRESLGPAVEMYCGGQDLRQPLLSPAICAGLSGLPPMLMQAGTSQAPWTKPTRLWIAQRSSSLSTSSLTIRRAARVFRTRGTDHWRQRQRQSSAR